MRFQLKGASGEITGRPFELSDDTLLGSGDEVDIRLDGLQDRHARIVYEDEILRLESVGECWVNGQPVTRKPLESGDELRLGAHRFVLQAPGLKPPRVLEAQSGRRPGRWFWLVIAALAAAGIAGLVFFLTRTGV